MSETKFTPGPWEVRLDDSTFGPKLEIHQEGAENRVPICERDLGFNDDVDEESKANAHLIAAAPEMYEAIEGLLNVISETRGEDARQAVIKANEVLAKARGDL